MIKKIIFSLVLLFLFSFSYAEQSIDDCTKIKEQYSILGNNIVKTQKNNIYSVNGYNKNVDWDIIKNDVVVYKLEDKKLKYSFKTIWDVKVSVHFKDNNCDIDIKKNISVYKTFIVAINDEKTSFIPYDQLKQKGIYFLNIKYNDIDSYKYILDNADYIIINQKHIIDFFSTTKNLSIWNKKFILLVDSFKWFYSKLIIPYIKNIYKNNIYIYSNNDFLNVLDSIYKDKWLDDKKLYAVSSIDDKIYFPISYFTNKLIEYGISIDNIWLVLVALFWVIVIAIFRQIIWFSVFWVYTPLLFVILMTVVWSNIALLLLILSIMSNIITFFITKKIYILYSSKIALNYILYVIISIIVVWWMIKYNIIWFENSDNSIILAFFIMPLLSKNLVKEETNLFSKTFWLFILEFVFISIILLWIFNFDTLKYILVAYPDLLWLFIIIIIIVWKFSGLQVLEYIRFYPLIKKWIYEEE